MLAAIACVAALPVFLGIILWLPTFKYSHIPGDLGSPVFGNLYKVFNTFTWRNINEMYHTISGLMDKYGDTVTNWFGPSLVIFTCDPAVVEEIKSNPAAKDREPLLYDRLETAFVGLLSTGVTGLKFKEFKKRMMKSLTKVHLGNYHEVFVKHSMELVEFLKEQNAEFDAYLPVSLMAIDAVIETHFGLQCLELKKRNFQFTKEIRKFITDLAHETVLTYARPKEYMIPLSENQKCFHKWCLDEMLKRVQNRAQGKVGGDRTYGEEIALEGIKKGLTRTQIDLQLREIFFVGSHTSSVTISSAMLFLAMYQDVQNKAWVEQMDILVDSIKSPSFEDLKRMNYLERVIRETLRFVSPPTSTRRITQDIKAGGLLIPKNSTVQIVNYKMLLNPKYWDNVNEFDPDHFLPENVAKRPATVGQLFGFGQRICPGAEYSMNEIKVVLSTVLRHFKLSTSLRLKDLQFNVGFMYEFDGPTLISVEPRVN